MNTEQLRFVRQLQKLYKDKYGEELHIDMLRMKGITVKNNNYDITAMQKYLKELEKRHGASVEKIKSCGSVIGEHMIAEQNLMADYCAAIQENYWNTKMAMGLIGRDRSSYYYYKLHKIKKTKHV